MNTFIQKYIKAQLETLHLHVIFSVQNKTNQKTGREQNKTEKNCLRLLENIQLIIGHVRYVLYQLKYLSGYFINRVIYLDTLSTKLSILILHQPHYLSGYLFSQIIYPDTSSTALSIWILFQPNYIYPDTLSTQLSIRILQRTPNFLHLACRGC